MKKYYDRIESISNATFVVVAKCAKIGELVEVDRGNRSPLFGIVVSINGDKVCIRALGTLKGISTGDRVLFVGRGPTISTGEEVLGRVFNAKGEVIDGGPNVQSEKKSVRLPVANPVNRKIPRNIISTNIPMIDVFNTLVKSQKISIFTVSGEPYNELLMRIANQTDADVVVLGLMSARYDDFSAFVKNKKEMGYSTKSVLFVHMATDYSVEALMIPDMVLTTADSFVAMGKSVLVLLTDMTAYADALKELSISMEQVPSNRGYPGELYSNLASKYEKAIDIEGSGSITIISVTTMPGDDVTHPVPDNTGYITEGQFYLKNSRIEPFGSLSRLKQNVIGGKDSRDDHGEIMNTMIRLYADALKSKELYSMGFKPSEFDNKLLKFCDMFESKIMNLNVNLHLFSALDLCWDILKSCFNKKEVGMSASLIAKHW